MPHKVEVTADGKQFSDTLPEGSDNTSREGKTIPLPAMEGGNASLAPGAPPPDMVKTVGGTAFDIKP